MSQIIAARFTTFPDAESAREKLYANGFVSEDVAEFFVNPAGQHARYPIGGDEYADPQARPAGLGATGGGAIGAIAGAIVAAVLTLVISHSVLLVAVSIAVGVYIGSLTGALLMTRGQKTVAPHVAVTEPHERESGVLLAVHVAAGQQADVARLLAEANGQDVEAASGNWHDGHWADFDPTRKVMPATDEPPGATGRFARPQ
jgi:hypothetical protein